MERLTYRDESGRAHLTLYGKKIYCSTQATADHFCAFEDRLEPKLPVVKEYSHGFKFYYCSSCGRYYEKFSAFNNVNYCDLCGQAVKWE